MKKGFSILVLPSRDTRIRRFVFTQRSVRVLFGGAVVVLGLGAWLLGDYLWMKFQDRDLRQLQLKAQSQKQQLSLLQEQAKNIQALLAEWSGTREKIQTALPPAKKGSVNGHPVIAGLEESLNSVQGELEQLIASIPSSWPAKGRVTSGVGKRVSPWTGKVEFHSGLDIPKPIGTPVYAPGQAVVEMAGESDGNGRTVILNHGQGLTTQYAHLSKIQVNKGEQVRKGQQIAEVGNTGKSTSSHLHYEVRVNGVPIDPRRGLIK